MDHSALDLLSLMGKFQLASLAKDQVGVKSVWAQACGTLGLGQVFFFVLYFLEPGFSV